MKTADRNIIIFLCFGSLFLQVSAFFDGTHPNLLYANILQIDSIEINTWRNNSVVPGLSRAISLDYHYSMGLIFWTDVLEMKIATMHIDNILNINEDIVRTKIGRPDGIAVDWIYNHLYWTDDVYRHIQVSNLDGSMRRTLIDYGIERPRALALDPNRGIMFFSDWGSVPRIERYHKDERLYWTDGALFQIKSSTLDGKDVKTIIKDVKYLPHPFGIAVHDQYVYWTNWEYKSLLRTNKYDGSYVETVQRDLTSPMDIKLYDSNVQPDLGANVCGYFNGGCSHLCFPSSPWSERKAKYTCSCPDGYDIESDNQTCTKHDAGLNHIQVSNLDGTFRKTLINSRLDEPRAVALLPHEGLMFFTDWGINPKIERCAMDGSERYTIITKEIRWPNGIVIDNIGRRIYWTDGYLQLLKSSTFDGTDVYTIVQFAQKTFPQPFGIELYDDQIYWTNWNAKSVYTVHKYKGNDMKPLITGLKAPRNLKIISKETQKKGTNLCGNNNGGCQHLCLPVPITLNSAGYSCVCADMFYKDNALQCIKKDPAELVKDEL
ncbi:Low-density lipoprotein receptor-related protein 4,Sortilin-related receptor,Low-density lipoprotein receptor-related protein 6 [Mytilus edulis]|uniref:Low-density lipoprotein receptor-related protein 4,Sortilin-related receptor,Low-density lipoprotein receptor-related protein 6 n=1 Tax=Mytilus edulis TaxID=6550 RepID=A0A8S3PM92_MYTED|nr:Low-density lipoprotein receptor-related protein 4,Sortilin-related receptor,Low-density lipoprotein receptor-related protein 6 [Mytilus edulis]